MPYSRAISHTLQPNMKSMSPFQVNTFIFYIIIIYHATLLSFNGDKQNNK